MLLTANPAISTLEAVMTGAGQVLLAFSVVFALLNCFFGYKLIKVWAAIAGFLLGWVIGFFAALYFLENVGACALIGVVAGVLCGLAAFFVYRVGVFLFCFFQGLSLCLALIPSWPGAVVGLIVGIALGVLAMKFLREVLILSSAVGGGMNASTGLFSLFGYLGNPLLMWVVGIALAAAGAFVQWKTTGEKKDGTSL